jgi:hypothetical protein
MIWGGFNDYNYLFVKNIDLPQRYIRMKV